MGSASFRTRKHGEVELAVDYGIERDDTSWLEGMDAPVMLVTGAAGFIGRYMVDLLTGLDYRVHATDIGPRPRYLSQGKFRGVEYARANLREEGEITSVVTEAKPAVVFHIGALFDFSAPAALLREVNVTGTERVCEAARNAGAKRVIYWSTGSIYAPSEEPVQETARKAPADPYARSKYEGELAAFAFHDPPRFEVYSVRPAMVSGILSHYGSGTVARLIHEGYLFGPPQKRGLLTAVVNARDVVTCGYLLAAKSIEGAASSADDTAFNAAARPVGIDKMMRMLADLAPRRCILGVPTRLAEVIGFGYQESLRFPESLLALVGRASMFATRALNLLRPSRLQPKIPPETIPYLTQPHAMSNTKARELLGWSPDPIEADLEETLRYYEETNWSGFERKASAERDPQIEVLDEAGALIRALEAEPDSDLIPMVKVPSLGLEIDYWSLRIFVRAAEAYILERAYEGKLTDLLGGALPHLASHALSDVALYLKHAYSRRFGDAGLPEAELPGLLGEVLKLDKKRVLSWVLAANVARFIKGIRDAGEILGRCSSILPEGGYGLLIETEFGDIAVEFQKHPSGQKISFPRAEVDSIPSHLPLQKRLDRLRKLRGMGLALATRFGDLLEILCGRADFDETIRLVTASPHRVLIKLSKRVSKAGWAALLFEDEEGRFVLGLDLGGRMAFFSPEKLRALEISRKSLSRDGLVDSFREATGVRLKLYPVAEFRKLLSDATYGGIVSRLLGR